MENPETAEMAAKSKMKLSATVLGLLILFGLAVEYERKTAPLGEVTVVYVRGGESGNVLAVATEVSAPAAASVSGHTKQDEEEVVGEFLDYLRDVSDKADAVTKPESALGQIVLPQPAPVESGELNEQTIEITDDNGEVVEIVEVKDEPKEQNVVSDEQSRAVVEEIADDQVAAAQNSMAVSETETSAAESVVEETKPSEPIVNTEESVLSDDENDGAVDMMKEIMERAQPDGAKK